MQSKFLFFLSTFVVVAIFCVGVRYVLRIQNERDFAEYVLIREKGMYTLVGSKPMILGNMFKPKEHKNPPPEGVKIRQVKHKTGIWQKDPLKLWYKWKKHHPTISKNFVFIGKENKFSNDLYLMNRQLIREILKIHYPIFVQLTGKEFDIDKVVSEIEDTKSYFWTDIFRGNVACGLLFGYGLENAEAFEKAGTNPTRMDPKLSNPSTRVRFENKVTLEDLPLPTFRIFSDKDPQVEYYNKERERIIAQYKNTDLRKLLIQAF